MSVTFVDKLLVCLDCGAEFEFTAEQQKLFAERGFTSEPKRCKDCRQRRKADERVQNGRLPAGRSEPFAAGPNGVGTFRRERRGAYRTGNGESAPPIRRGDRRMPPGPRQNEPASRRDGTLYDATCAACGAATRVPFRPAEGRPVYCRNCHYLKRTAEVEG